MLETRRLHVSPRVSNPTPLLSQAAAAKPGPPFAAPLPPFADACHHSPLPATPTIRRRKPRDDGRPPTLMAVLPLPPMMVTFHTRWPPPPTKANPRHGLTH